MLRSCAGYLVDPASSHMLVSKIKPCTSKFRPSEAETANGSIHQLWFIRSCAFTWTVTVGILELIHAVRLRLPATVRRSAFIRPKPTWSCLWHGPVSGFAQGFGDSE